ncbi:hypothetical protein PR048_021118 [Dryococelus australis]|uniref:Uncharacterized protein n=1 Tax=Dryococelus australis TaxID=614101 RepID=A0ABQ9GXC7_9NEOP|nr:hypothetical protein PR048_021118 [Dryococelus australis]
MATFDTTVNALRQILYTHETAVLGLAVGDSLTLKTLGACGEVLHGKLVLAQSDFTYPRLTPDSKRSARSRSQSPPCSLGNLNVFPTTRKRAARDMLHTSCDCSPPTWANRVLFPAGSLPNFTHVGIVPDVAAGRRVRGGGGMSRGYPAFPRPFIPALLHTRPHFTLIASSGLYVLTAATIQQVIADVRTMQFVIACTYLWYTVVHFIFHCPYLLQIVGNKQTELSANSLTASPGYAAARSVNVSKTLITEHMRVKRGEYGAVPEWKGGGNGRSPRKPADQRHRPARFPNAKIRQRPRRELKPVRLAAQNGWTSACPARNVGEPTPCIQLLDEHQVLGAVFWSEERSHGHIIHAEGTLDRFGCESILGCHVYPYMMIVFPREVTARARSGLQSSSQAPPPPRIIQQLWDALQIAWLQMPVETYQQLTVSDSSSSCCPCCEGRCCDHVIVWYALYLCSARVLHPVDNVLRADNIDINHSCQGCVGISTNQTSDKEDWALCGYSGFKFWVVGSASRREHDASKVHGHQTSCSRERLQLDQHKLDGGLGGGGGAPITIAAGRASPCGGTGWFLEPSAPCSAAGQNKCRRRYQHDADVATDKCSHRLPPSGRPKGGRCRVLQGVVRRGGKYRSACLERYPRPPHEAPRLTSPPRCRR